MLSFFLRAAARGSGLRADDPSLNFLENRVPRQLNKDTGRPSPEFSDDARIRQSFMKKIPLLCALLFSLSLTAADIFSVLLAVGDRA